MGPDLGLDTLDFIGLDSSGLFLTLKSVVAIRTHYTNVTIVTYLYFISTITIQNSK